MLREPTPMISIISKVSRRYKGLRNTLTIDRNPRTVRFCVSKTHLWNKELGFAMLRISIKAYPNQFTKSSSRITAIDGILMLPSEQSAGFA
jgi:hypothetical protein